MIANIIKIIAMTAPRLPPIIAPLDSSCNSDFSEIKPRFN